MMPKEEQLQQEWLVINAMKELLAIVKRQPGLSYYTAINFAKENMPEFFTSALTQKIRKSSLEKLFEKFRQEAYAKSQRAGKPVTTEDLIIERLNDLKDLLIKRQFNTDLPDLKKEAKRLEKLLKNVGMSSLNYERITENQAIQNDAFLRRTDKIWKENHLGKFNSYRNKADGSLFRIAILHPGQPEAITGVDLIYEHYSQDANMVRFSAIQYKIWENDVLYFSQSGNIADQLRKMEVCFCGKGLCNDDTKSNVSGEYRFPYCSAFLRPTDKLQRPNKMITSGYHIPVCKMKSVSAEGPDQPIIYLEAIKNFALKSHTFEELFNSEMVGSRWLQISVLEKLYRDSRILQSKENLVLYAQNISMTNN